MNIKNLHKNNKFKLSGTTWNEEFKLSDGSYSTFGIQYYFKYIIKEHETLTNKPPVETYINRFQSRVTFKIMPGYNLAL